MKIGPSLFEQTFVHCLIIAILAVFVKSRIEESEISPVQSVMRQSHLQALSACRVLFKKNEKTFLGLVKYPPWDILYNAP